MKIVKSSVSILPQQPGVDGLMKHVEKIGRLAYKSEDKITEDSWERFDNMLFLEVIGRFLTQELYISVSQKRIDTTWRSFSKLLLTLDGIITQ